MSIFTSAAEIHFVTFEHFLDEVSTLEVCHDRDFMVTYTEQVRSGGIFGGSVEFEGYGMETSIYQNRRIELDRHVDIHARKHQLEIQLPYENKPYPNNLKMMVEDITVQSVIHYGTPTLAVNIGPRQWMVCDPNDFVILKSPVDIKSTLICTHKYRNKIVHIGRK